MTPTEQDKMSDIDKLEKRLAEWANRVSIGDLMPDTLVRGAVELITADRKRMALEARINERNKIALDTYRGKTVSESTNWQAKFEYFMDNNERRIAELKAQQEKV